MQPATHIIGKQSLKLRYNGAQDPLALRQMISRICNDELPVRLNALFDRYDDKDFVLRLDKLDVSLEISENGDLQEQLVQEIVEKVETVLRQKLEKRNEQSMSIDRSFARTLRFYLEHGYLPWWSLTKEVEAFKQALHNAWKQQALRQIVTEVLPLLQDANACVRLLSILDNQAFDAFVLAASVWSSDEWNAWKNAFQIIQPLIEEGINEGELNHSMKAAVLAIIAAKPSSSNANEQLAKAIANALQKNRNIKAVYEAFTLSNAAQKNIAVQSVLASLASALKEKERTGSESIEEIRKSALLTEYLKEARRDEVDADEHQLPEEGERILVSNAGMVIIALYLPRFFSNLNLLEDGKLKDVSKAIALLRYLVFEQASFEEFDVVLEKILCGLPLAESVAERHEVSADEQEQIHALLQSVIEHWTVLKNTTPAGLRYNFLLREGKLLFKGNQWELTVQKMAHDMLLDYLPWNISIVKLPWMKHMLNVKWN